MVLHVSIQARAGQDPGIKTQPWDQSDHCSWFMDLVFEFMIYIGQSPVM